MNITMLLAACIMVCASPCLAQDTENEKEGPEIESWYTYLAIGFTDLSYPTSSKAIVNKVNRSKSKSKLSLEGGSYWPLKNERTLIGCVANIAMDRYGFSTRIF